MKTLKVSLVSLLLLAGLTAPLVHAEAESPAKEESGRPDRPGKGPGPGQRAERMKHLSETLGLTDAQKVQVEALFREELAAMKAIRDDAALADDARRAKGRELRESYRGKLRALLTPEQQAKFDAMPKPPHGGPRGDKKPE
jgi:Spy/CpxP family protein refolding chaperone